MLRPLPAHAPPSRSLRHASAAVVALLVLCSLAHCARTTRTHARFRSEDAAAAARFTATTRSKAATRWEPAIRAFEREDRTARPPAHAIVFVGSSSIVRWDLAASFPGFTCLNRGFGGSYMEDAARYADRIVVPYEPRAVVVYAGDNDIAHGRTPAEVARAARTLAARIHKQLPATRIVFVSIKPSPLRWHRFAEMQRANRQIAEVAAADERASFVDVTAAMLGADGKPRPELYAEDRLHLSPAGYELWATLLRSYIEEEHPRAATAATETPGSTAH